MEDKLERFELNDFSEGELEYTGRENFEQEVVIDGVTYIAEFPPGTKFRRK